FPPERPLPPGTGCKHPVSSDCIGCSVRVRPAFLDRPEQPAAGRTLGMDSPLAPSAGTGSVGRASARPTYAGGRSHHSGRGGAEWRLASGPKWAGNRDIVGLLVNFAT